LSAKILNFSYHNKFKLNYFFDSIFFNKFDHADSCHPRGQNAVARTQWAPKSAFWRGFCSFDSGEFADWIVFANFAPNFSQPHK